MIFNIIIYGMWVKIIIKSVYIWMSSHITSIEKIFIQNIFNFILHIITSHLDFTFSYNLPKQWLSFNNFCERLQRSQPLHSWLAPRVCTSLTLHLCKSSSKTSCSYYSHRSIMGIRLECFLKILLLLMYMIV